MKVLFINSLYHPYHLGGAEISLQLVAEGLVKNGSEVIVICLGQEDREAYVNGVKIYYKKIANIYWPFGRRQSFIKRIVWNLIDCNNVLMGQKVARILKIERPDIVHTNNIQGFSPRVWKVIKKEGFPLVHTLRDHFLLCPRSNMFRNNNNCNSQCLPCRVFSLLKRHLSHNVDYVVGISAYILKRHLQFGWFPACRQAVINNPCESHSKPPHSYQKKTLKFGFIGRLGGYKGIKELCKSFKKLTEFCDAELIIAGTGEEHYLLELKKMTTGFPVHFLGFVEPEKFYSKVNVVVVPSKCNEAFGRSVVEAYAHGIPVIASSLGGLPEIVKPNETGFVFDPEKQGDLLACMKKMSTTGKLPLYREACLRFAEDFSTSDIVEQYYSVYKSIVGGKQNSLK